MLPILLVSCALCQPVAAQTPASSASSQPETPAVKADPTPLDKVLEKTATERQLGRGPGAYFTIKRMVEWAEAANPSDADAAKRVWAKWDEEVLPGFEAIMQEFCRRSGNTLEGVLTTFVQEMEPALENIKPKMTPQLLHAMIEKGSLGVREQPSSSVSWLYAFDPRRAGDDMKLISSGKTRTVQARLNSTGGQGSVLKFSVPLSWDVGADKPGAFVVSENAGVGPLMITVSAFPTPKGGTSDGVKLASRLANSADEHGVAVAVDLAGKPGGRMWTRVNKPVGKDTLCGRYDYIFVVNGEISVSVAVAVAAMVTNEQREYTTAELAAYADSHKAVADWVLGTFAFGDAPVVAPAVPAAPAK